MFQLPGTLMEKEQILEFAKTGVYCEYDLFGLETSYYQLAHLDMPSDAQRIQRIKWLLEGGYMDQVLMAHDLHTKHRMVRHNYAPLIPLLVG